MNTLSRAHSIPIVPTEAWFKSYSLEMCIHVFVHLNIKNIATVFVLNELSFEDVVWIVYSCCLNDILNIYPGHNVCNKVIRLIF